MPSAIAKIFDARGFQRVGTLPIASGQTFKAGDFLSLNSSGQLQQAVTAGNGSSTNGQCPVWSSGATNLIVGRAIEDAQPSVNDPTILPATKTYGRFVIAEPGTQFKVPLYHATPGSAYPSPAFIGQYYELWNLSSSATFATGTTVPASAYFVRIDKTSVNKCLIVDFSGDDYQGWPEWIGQASAPSSGTVSQYCGTWIEIIGQAAALSSAATLTRTN